MTTTLWGGLGNAGTIAQLVGVDAAGLISMILQAVQTVERNKKRCWQLVHQVLIIGELLPLLQQSSDMMARPEIRRPLEGLEDTLRQTYMLVTSCQQGNIVHRLLMAGSQAQKFHSGHCKGVLPNGLDIAIKTCHLFDFKNELQIIPKLQHANIIKLLGCCTEGDRTILVYEYMPRGSLHNIIQELKADVFLSWPLRFRIIEGIAQGAVYLQQHSRLRVVHGDLSANNILLDCNMTPRITDFGMAEVLNSDEDEKSVAKISGTRGYIDPVFNITGIISVKTDVYAFGVTILGIIIAQDAVNHTDNRRSFLDYAWEFWSSGRAMELVDASLHDEPRISEILRCMQIALLCVQYERADRPTMSDVLMMLKCEGMALPVPRAPPSYTWRQEAGDSTSDGSEAEGSTSYRSA